MIRELISVSSRKTGGCGNVTRNWWLRVIQKILALGAKAVWDEKTELLEVNDELRVSIVLCRHTQTGAGFVALADPAGCQ